MRDETQRNGSWQSYLLSIGAVVIGAGIMALASALTGLRSDIEVVKTDIKYLKEQAAAAQAFRAEIGNKITDHEVRLKLIESDNTRTNR
jgi:hypothetical protein